MIKIKTLLRILGAVSLTTITVSSVVACGGGTESKYKANNIIKMDTQIKKDFYFIEKNNKPTIPLTISVIINNYAKTINVNWISAQLLLQNADHLLWQNHGESDNARSIPSGDFLVNVLKLKPISGTGENRTFKHNDAKAIKMKVKSYLPIITKKSDNTDYVVTGGTVHVNFEKDNTQIGDIYSLDISSSINEGLVVQPFVLPAANKISMANFNTIPGFAVGQSKSVFKVGRDLTQDFKFKINEGKIVQVIADLIKQGDLKIKVSKAADSGNFSWRDSIEVKISIGEVTFPTEYILVIE